MIVGCFTLHLYCDDPRHTDTAMGEGAEFTGETRAECFRAARQQGWYLTANRRTQDGQGYATCPLHQRKAPARKRT